MSSRFELIRAGLVGGKTVPDTVTDNPLLFVTLTAPSFGAVHGPRPRAGQRVGGRCHPRDKARLCEHGRPVGCMTVHDQDDPVNGSPLCVDCYDWTSAVVWQWWSSSELFRRTSQNARRVLADRLRVSEARLRQVASLQYAKVAEYQARGLVHFHALARLDGPDGPGSPAPLDGHDFVHREEQDAERLRAGQLWTESGRVFTKPTGETIIPASDYHAWKALLKRAGVRDARLHDARHTAATMLLVLGVSERTVMSVMGWSSTAMAARYQHVTDPIRRDVAARVGGLLWASEDEDGEG